MKVINEPQNPLLEQIWVPRYPQEPIRIKDMTEAHAKNALAYIMDKLNKGHPCWTNQSGMFKYDPTIVNPKPRDPIDEMRVTLDAIAFLLTKPRED